MTGRGIVLLDEQKREVAELAACYVDMLGGSDRVGPDDRALADRVALDAVRSRQAHDMEEGLLIEDSVNAEFAWAHTQETAALDLAEGLARKPALISHKLEETTQGCAYKIAEWEALRLILDEDQAPWDDHNRATAFNLLGVPHDYRRVSKKLDTIDLQRAVANDEIERLRKKQTDWLDRLDAFRREQTISGVIFPSKAVWRLRLHGMAATRRYLSGFSQIQKRQQALRDGSTPRPDPEIRAAAALDRERAQQQTSRKVRESEAEFKAMIDAPARPKAPTLSSAVAPTPTPKPTPKPTPVATKPEPPKNDPSAERKQRRAEKKRQRQARKRS